MNRSQVKLVRKMQLMMTTYTGRRDVFGRIQKFIEIENMRTTRKWTVHFFEMLWSMILAQSSLFGRWPKIIKNQPKRIQNEIIKSLLDKTEVLRVAVALAARAPIFLNEPVHRLLLFPLGSRAKDGSRTCRYDCRVSPKFDVVN
jgi:hypothetical protein